jgi:hypothetical protein
MGSPFLNVSPCFVVYFFTRQPSIEMGFWLMCSRSYNYPLLPWLMVPHKHIEFSGTIEHANYS